MFGLDSLFIKQHFPYLFLIRKKILRQLTIWRKNKRVSKAWNSIVKFCRKERISRIKITKKNVTKYIFESEQSEG